MDRRLSLLILQQRKASKNPMFTIGKHRVRKMVRCKVRLLYMLFFKLVNVQIDIRFNF